MQRLVYNKHVGAGASELGIGITGVLTVLGLILLLGLERVFMENIDYMLTTCQLQDHTQSAGTLQERWGLPGTTGLGQ